MKLDIVSKLWIEQCAEPFLRELLGVKPVSMESLEEIAQEQPSISRADYVFKIKAENNEHSVFLLEFLTHWIDDKLIDLARYTLFCKKKLRLRVYPTLILFNPHFKATPVYRDENTRFRCRLVKMWELDAKKFFRKHIPELYPLIPLMKGGVELAEEVNQALMESNLGRLKKTDLLAVFSTFLGLRDKAKAATIVREQRDHMNVFAESPIFKQVLKMGRDKGLKAGRTKGLAQGKNEGRAEGLREGRAAGLREGIKMGLEMRFGRKARELNSLIDGCNDLYLLKCALEEVKTTDSLSAFRERLQAE